jgi:hypothetical protein
MRGCGEAEGEMREGDVRYESNHPDTASYERHIQLTPAPIMFSKACESEYDCD